MKLSIYVSDRVDADRVVDGVIIRSLNSEDQGALLIATENVVDLESDYLNSTRLVHRKGGSMETLKNFVKEWGLKPGSDITETFGTEYSIQIEESTTPFWGGQMPKRRGADGPVLTLNDEPIYRTTHLVKGADANHKRIAHNGQIEFSDYETMVAEKQLENATEDELK